MSYRYCIVMIEYGAPTAEGDVLSMDYYANPHIVKEEKRSALIEIWDDDRKLSYHTFALKHLDHEHCL